MSPDPTTIDEYIAAYPKDVQAQLQKLREAVRSAAPKAEETIKYKMPTFMLDGNLVYFAAFKSHIGFFGTSTESDAALKAKLAPYAGPKGSLKFPYGEPVPYELIRKAVRIRVKQNHERVAARKKK